jgi:hypothetical protein
MGLLTRIARVFVEVLIIMYYLEPMYEDFRTRNEVLNLPKVDSLWAVFAVTLVSDVIVFG